LAPVVEWGGFGVFVAAFEADLAYSVILAVAVFAAATLLALCAYCAMARGPCCGRASARITAEGFGRARELKRATVDNAAAAALESGNERLALELAQAQARARALARKHERELAAATAAALEPVPAASSLSGGPVIRVDSLMQWHTRPLGAEAAGRHSASQLHVAPARRASAPHISQSPPQQHRAARRGSDGDARPFPTLWEAATAAAAAAAATVPQPALASAPTSAPAPLLAAASHPRASRGAAGARHALSLVPDPPHLPALASAAAAASASAVAPRAGAAGARHVLGRSGEHHLHLPGAAATWVGGSSATGAGAGAGEGEGEGEGAPSPPPPAAAALPAARAAAAAHAVRGNGVDVSFSL